MLTRSYIFSNKLYLHDYYNIKPFNFFVYFIVFKYREPWGVIKFYFDCFYLFGK